MKERKVGEMHEDDDTAKSEQKMGNMGNSTQNELECAPSNDPFCYPSFTNFDNKIEPLKVGDRVKYVGSNSMLEC